MVSNAQGSNDPIDLIVMGSLGDLARRKLFPALYQLVQDEALNQPLRILALTRTKVRLEDFSAAILPHVINLSDDNNSQNLKPPANWQAFLSHITLATLDLKQESQYQSLCKHFTKQTSSQRIFYLAIPPNLYGTVTHHLKSNQCINANSRVVLEKPIGHDLASAVQINEQLKAAFNENQIFRIDHYLGKETVQNIMALRFANTVLEPLWCAQHIECMQITVAESIDVGSRADYYESAGALRDMVQNHILQLLCIIAMEPPTRLNADAVRAEKLKVLQALRPIESHDVVQKTVRGQYWDLHALGDPSYRQTPGVHETSETETFVAIKAELDNWRWAGMPIYLRTGKCLKQRHSEIVIQFKEVPHKLFQSRGSIMSANRLRIVLQPAESIRLSLNGKAPGKGMHLAPLLLNLDATQQPKKRAWDAYERLLLDVMHSDLTLFMREAEIESAWRWVDPILSGWDHFAHPAVAYAPGTWGPLESDHLLARDGYVWHNPEPIQP